VVEVALLVEAKELPEVLVVVVVAGAATVLFSVEVLVIPQLLPRAKETAVVEQLNTPLAAVVVLAAMVLITTILFIPVGAAPEWLQPLPVTLLIMLAVVVVVEILLAIRPAV
jgi:hypothetical protein